MEPPRHDYVEEVIHQIREAIRDRDYETVHEIVQLEKNNPLFQDNMELKQFLLWHEGICIFYIKKDTEQSLKMLEKALFLTKGKRISISAYGN